MSINSHADWVLRIDADERISNRLRDRLLTDLPQAPKEVTGFTIPVRICFLGRDLRYGDTYPVWLLRIWRNGQAICETTWMDEHMVLSGGRVQQIHGDLIHDIPKNLTEWTSKHNWYASRECRDIITQGTLAPLEGHARARRWLKHNVYLRLPLFCRALFYWFYRYFLRLGFLDGKEGLIYHFLQAFWYRFLVDAKLYEIQKPSRQERSDVRLDTHLNAVEGARGSSRS